MTDVQPHQPLNLRPWTAPSASSPSGPRLALSTRRGIDRLADFGDLVDEARRLGIDRLALGPGCTADRVEQLIARLGDDVRLCSLTNVCPLPLDDDGRPALLPSLAEPDSIAREVIVRWTEETIRLASYWGVPIVVVHLGAGTGLTGSDGAERRDSVADAAFDAAVRSLDDLLPLCEEAGVRLALATPATRHELPSFEELFELLARYPTAPLGYWHDTGHAHSLQQQSLRPASDWLTTFADRLTGYGLYDANGGSSHLPPGDGEIDFAAALGHATAETPCVVDVSGDASEADVARGLAHLRARLPSS